MPNDFYVPPKKASDCPALAVCKEIGTASKNCRAGSDLPFKGHCQASIVLLLSRIFQNKGQEHQPDSSTP